jgi:hypothetical protein
MGGCEAACLISPACAGLLSSGAASVGTVANLCVMCANSSLPVHLLDCAAGLRASGKLTVCRETEGLHYADGAMTCACRAAVNFTGFTGADSACSQSQSLESRTVLFGVMCVLLYQSVMMVTSLTETSV